MCARPLFAAVMTALLAVLIAVAAQPAAGARTSTPSIQVDLEPDPANPAQPKMDDRLRFQSAIRNIGLRPIKGVVAWLGLVQVDPGQEQQVDLEDWSAREAVTVAELAPGQSVSTDWPMRLIAAGHYRVVVSAAAGDGALLASPFRNVTVQQKPVVESGRVLPVALGMPALLLGGLLLRRRRGRGEPL